MSRVCRSVNEEPSVTRYCIVSSFVVSIVGAYSSDSTPPATVYQIFDVVLRAVPRQSFRARSKWLKAPGPPAAGPGAATAAGTAAASEPTTTAPTARTTNQDRARMAPPAKPDATVCRPTQPIASAGWGQGIVAAPCACASK